VFQSVAKITQVSWPQDAEEFFSTIWVVKRWSSLDKESLANHMTEISLQPYFLTYKTDLQHSSICNLYANI